MIFLNPDDITAIGVATTKAAPKSIPLCITNAVAIAVPKEASGGT